MTIVKKSASLVALLAVLALAPAATEAQEQQRISVTFTPAVVTVAGDAELGLAGSVGYRFSEHLSFEGDFTWIDAAAGGLRDRQFMVDGPDFMTGAVNDILRRGGGMFGGNIGNHRLPIMNVRPPNLPTMPIGIGDLRASASGQTTIGTLGVRYEPSVETARFRPYVAGGVGLNYTNQEFTLESTAIRPFDESLSHSGMAFSAGGGASIRLFSSLWADVDAKYFRLSRDRNLMRLGGGVSVKF